MKKRFLLPLIVALLVLIPCVVASAASYYYVSGTSWLRMRNLPADDANILASYRKDYAVTSLKKYNKEWSYVSFSDGHEGYVQTKYLKSSSAGYAWITTNDTILRSGPAKTFSRLASLPKGEKVKVLTAGASWSYIYSTNYGYGYVNKNYLSKKAVSSDTVYASFSAVVVNPNNRSVNLRSGAGKSYSVIAEVAPGTQVTVLSYGSTWSKLQLASGTEGYMMNEFLQRTSAVETIGPSEAPTFAPTAAPTPFANYTAYITSDNGRSVNVRSGPGTGWALVTQAPVGTAVTVVEHTSSSWYRIYVNNAYGYVMKKYITTTAPAVGPGGSGNPGVTTRTAWIYAVDGKSVNIRNGMGTGYGIVSRVQTGSKITVIEDTDNSTWSHISYGSITGYVMKKFIVDSDPGTISGSDATPTPAAPSGTSYTAYITSQNGKSVNVRTGAGSGYSLAGSLKYGTQVTVTGSKYVYYHIKAGSLDGYVQKDFITTTKPDPLPDDPSGSGSASSTKTVVTPDGEPVNMRKGAGTGYTNVTRINHGETVRVIRTSGKWSYCEYNGLYGYIMTKFLQ